MPSDQGNAECSIAGVRRVAVALAAVVTAVLVAAGQVAPAAAAQGGGCFRCSCGSSLRSHLPQRAASAAAHQQGHRSSHAACRLVVRRGLRRRRPGPHHRPSLPQPHKHRYRGLRRRRHGETAVHDRFPYAFHLDRPYLIAVFVVRSRSRVGQSLPTDRRPFVAVQWWPSADLSRVDPHGFKPHPPAP